MAKIFSNLFLVLIIVLFPPATLAVITNDALPGDMRYPIKRVMEEAIVAVASVHPTARSWFSIVRVDRRFQEANGLIAKDQDASQSLAEFSIQTDIAAQQVKIIKNTTQKKELIENLSQSIIKYDAKLETVQQQLIVPSDTPPDTLSPPSLASPMPSPILKQQFKNNPKQIQQVREEIRQTLSELETDPIILEETELELPAEIVEAADLDKYLNDLYNLDVLDIKLLLTE